MFRELNELPHIKDSDLGTLPKPVKNVDFKLKYVKFRIRLHCRVPSLMATSESSVACMLPYDCSFSEFLMC